MNTIKKAGAQRPFDHSVEEKLCVFIDLYLGAKCYSAYSNNILGDYIATVTFLRRECYVIYVYYRY